ncbi:hypothetical protein B0H67DRAFT_125684 [Lasiosphaeris hirsuta]|uniref:Glycosyl transferase n=1 Tax=Lasiosphaeris hirsuta TaxID=260670 RepID=A0AA40B079_9PEZI|nr:hypothetical protein B0H67DRAFT_125684 [Lasiosphaeris hirsuta]
MRAIVCALPVSTRDGIWLALGSCGRGNEVGAGAEVAQMSRHELSRLSAGWKDQSTGSISGRLAGQLRRLASHSRCHATIRPPVPWILGYFHGSWGRCLPKATGFCSDCSDGADERSAGALMLFLFYYRGPPRCIRRQAHGGQLAPRAFFFTCRRRARLDVANAMNGNTTATLDRQWRTHSTFMKKRWPRYGILIGFAVFTLLVFLFARLSAVPTKPTFDLSQLEADYICNGLQNNTTASTSSDVIPNYVHYIWLLKDPAVFRLDFKVFVSIYSAHVYFQPERIFIHTDAAPSVLELAKTSGDVWTRRILALPEIAFNHVTAPTSTNRGVKITQMEHKADFLRIEALRTHGGIYMDMDAVPLRDVAPLRRAGFANVAGGAVALTMKHAGYVNNGVLLARPNTILMNIWLQASHLVFDGKWATASIHLLTDLVYRLGAIPSEVLIVHPRTFAPTSWEVDDQRRLFEPNLGAPLATAQGVIEEDPTGRPRELKATCLDAMAYLGEREREGARNRLEMDFSSTYVLHAFDDEIHRIRGWDHEVNLQYVMARKSNYARAVYPAIWHAVHTGIIPEKEARLH